MVSIFRRAGRKGYTLKWKDRRGSSHMRQFKTRQLAEDAALDLRKHPDSGTEVTLQAYAEKWLENIESEIRASSHTSYRYLLNTHVLPALGHFRLKDLRRSHVKEFLSHKKADGYKPGTVARMRRVLYSVLEEARDDEHIHDNPAALRKGRGKTHETHREQIKALDEEQLTRFLNAALRVCPDRYPLFRLLAGTGLRPGEAFGLQWDDVDLVAGQLLVHRTVTNGVTGPVKTHRSNRPVDLASCLVNVMLQWDADTKARALATGKPRPPWVFAGARGGPTYHSPIESDLKAALKAAGLPGHHSPHSLRHTYASLLLADGESPVYVQEQLGHASITLTVDLYGRWLRKKSTGARDRLDARMSPFLSPAVAKDERSGNRTDG